jgi:sporulation protein YlmC with PRC-barrel domain
MKIAWEQLNHLSVYTQSGQKLGLVEGVAVDTDAHAVAQYVVKPNGVIRGLFTKQLLIGPAEVISITTEKMTVKDNLQGLPESNGGRTRLALTPKPGVELSELED